MFILGKPLIKSESHDDIIVVGSDDFNEDNVSCREYIDVQVVSCFS